MFFFVLFFFLISLSLQDDEVNQNFKSKCVCKYQSYDIVGDFVFNKKRDKYLFSGKRKYFGVEVAFSIVEIDGKTKELVSEQCRPTDLVKLDGMFSWIKYAKEIGREKIADQECDMYSLYVSQTNQTLLLCIRDDKIPVYFSISGEVGSEFTFFNQSPGDYEVVIPEICTLPLNVCKPQQPVVQTMPMTRFHAKGDHSLANENTGTMMGDVFFVCYSKVHNVSSSHPMFQNRKNSARYEQVSIFDVSVNTTWSQYALCNFRKCIGGMPGTVGREVALGNAPWGGQCSENKILGSWFSLLERDECKDDQKVGDDGCAWKLLDVKKSIDYECLAKHGFEEACKQDAHPPFTKSLKVFQQAFDSDVFSQGGCPDVK